MNRNKQANESPQVIRSNLLPPRRSSSHIGRDYRHTFSLAINEPLCPQVCEGWTARPLPAGRHSNVHRLSDRFPCGGLKMTCNKKAASPFQAGTLGETASKTTVRNRNTTHTFRQQINQIIVMLAAEASCLSAWRSG